jgi:hypothetical protein
MTRQNNIDSPQSTIEEYIEACRVGSDNRLRAIFHPNALMAGFYQGEFYMGSPDPFYEEVRDSPAPIEAGLDYRGDITTIEISGDIASVTLNESGYLGTDFTNWFHLAKIEGEWKIICKSYYGE